MLPFTNLYRSESLDQISVVKRPVALLGILNFVVSGVCLSTFTFMLANQASSEFGYRVIFVLAIITVTSYLIGLFCFACAAITAYAATLISDEKEQVKGARKMEAIGIILSVIFMGSVFMYVLDRSTDQFLGPDLTEPYKKQVQLSDM
ncbi:MAG: hypothetical protein RIF37_08785 [Rhodospirillaceae bacterium]